MLSVSERTVTQSAFWQLTPEDAASLLSTSLDAGLSEVDAQERLEAFGRNTISTSRRSSWLTILFNQLKSPLILILIAAGAVTLFISHYRDAAFIFIAVVVNSALGFYQENKAEHALASLKTYLKQCARVVREKKEREINAEELVPGDIIRLAQGDRVPADARLLAVNDLQVDEAVLTGESLPVGKEVEVAPADAGISDQSSMLFAGTLVTQGLCTAIVCRTSAATELGKIAALIAKSEHEKTPLQKTITTFSIYSSIALGVLTLIVFGVGVAAGYSRVDMFLTAVAIAVSAIPEGLPVSMTVILAVGVERMAKRKGVVRKLVAAEALGSTTVILTDKTGTLTMAQMMLSQVLPFGASTESQLLSQALTNASVLIENPADDPNAWRMNGRIMEMALVRAAALRGVLLEKITDKHAVLQSMPFNAVQKFSASLVKRGDIHEVVFFGAPDILLARSALDGVAQKTILRQIEEFASSGERVLGVASKAVSGGEDFSLSKDVPTGSLSFDGLITFRDPVRPSIASVMKRVHDAGIKTVILTGDHRGTAVAVAREIGMAVDDRSVLDASELEGLSDRQLMERLPRLSVIARVTPFDKLRIATLYQKMGEVVAMTGDGVNDAPSIKQADVGIAMGSGTEVAQSVADLVLLDDNFETIVAAVEEGRQIVGNIRRVLVYLLSSITDELILIGGALIVGVPLPLSALQILWVNFFADSFPAIAFAFEKEPNALMHRPHRTSLFDRPMRFLIVVIGFSTSVFLFALYLFLTSRGHDAQLVRTFMFAAFGTYTLFVAFSVRSLERSIFSFSLFSNRYLTGGTLLGVMLMVAAIYLPALQVLLGTVALPLPWVGGVLLIGVFNIALIEGAKRLFKMKRYTEKSYA